jgi:hypothetical protein
VHVHSHVRVAGWHLWHPGHWQVLGYLSLKYFYYRTPFSWHNWGMVFPMGAFATAVTIYHNSDALRSITNAFGVVSLPERDPTAKHFTAYLAWFAAGFASLLTAWLFIRTVVAIAKMVCARAILLHACDRG